MKLCIIGTGYVGLVAAAGFADMGNDVICVDVDEGKIAGLKRGELPIYEPGLDELVKKNTAEGRMQFTTDLASAVPGTAVVFLAVGTPQSDTGAANLQYIFEAAEAVGRAIRGHTLIVTKSTVPVGTGDEVRNRLSKLTKQPFSVCSNPEFLKEGTAVNDFMRPERVIVGVSDPTAAELLRYLYEPFVRTNGRFLVMDVRSAELTKYACNAMLATRISFMNEIANLCERVGADVEHVRQGVGSDGRIGPKFLFPGVGFGGSCFPKDLQALMHTGRQTGLPMQVIEAVDRVNHAQKKVLGDKLCAHFADGLKGRRIAVWGLAFKPGTDDVREAPSIEVIRRILAEGATVVAHDPVAIDAFRKHFGEHEGVRYAETHYEACQGADAVVLVTEWGEYRRPAFDRILELMAHPVLFDGRNIWNPQEVARNGFRYYGIGRLPA